jgi:hypothetical protein
LFYYKLVADPQKVKIQCFPSTNCRSFWLTSSESSCSKQGSERLTESSLIEIDATVLDVLNTDATDAHVLKIVQHTDELHLSILQSGASMHAKEEISWLSSQSKASRQEQKHDSIPYQMKVATTPLLHNCPNN